MKIHDIRYLPTLLLGLCFVNIVVATPTAVLPRGDPESATPCYKDAEGKCHDARIVNGQLMIVEMGTSGQIDGIDQSAVAVKGSSSALSSSLYSPPVCAKPTQTNCYCPNKKDKNCKKKK